MRHFLFFFFLIIGTLAYSQGNVPLHNLRHASGPDFIIRSSQNGQSAWVKDTIYFPKVFTVASSPLTAKKGDFWRSTANGNTYLWDGVTWQLIAKMDGDTSSLNELIQSVSYAGGFLNIEDNGGTYTVDLRDTLFGTIDTTGLVALIRNVAPLTDSIAWSNVKNKPLTFTPSTHTHVVSDVTGLQDSLNIRANETTASIQSKRPLKTIETQSLEGSGNIDLVKADVGLSNVDNTSDINKPISTATQTALDDKFTLPSLTSGSVLFSNGSTITQDNSNLFWDDTNNRLGIDNASPLAKIHVGNYNNNPSTDAKILISHNVSSVNAEHGFADGSIINNGNSYNSFDARVTINSTLNDVNEHYAAFQSVPTITSGVTLRDYFGLFDGVANNGTITNYYGAYMAGNNATNYSGLYVNGTQSNNTNGYGMNLLNLNAANAYGVNISGINGSLISRGISIANMNGNNQRPIYSEHSQSFSPNELKFTGNGDSDMLLFSRGSVNGGEKIGMVWEAGSGATKYYSNRISSSFDNSLKGDLIFDTNETGASSLGALSEKIRLKGDGKLGIGTSTPSAKLHIVDGDYYQTWANNNPRFLLGSALSVKNYGGIQWNYNANADLATLAIGASDINGLINTMYLTPAGNVGVGTSTPTQKLEVAGKIKSYNDENVSKQVVSYDDPITTTSIYSGKTLKIHALKNVFSGLSRFTRTDTITGSTRKTTWKIKPEYSNITYPEGEIYFSSWYGQEPDSIRVRVRNESGVWYGPFTTTQNLSQNAPFGYYKVPISNNSNYTREIEITSVYASTVYDYQELNYNLKTSEGFTDNTFVSSSGGNIYGNINVVGNIKAVIPSYASTAAAAGDTNLSSGSFFKVTNGNGTSALHIKD